MGEVVVKAGKFTSEKTIDAFVNQEKDWIEKQKKYYAEKYHHRIDVKKEDIPTIKKQLLPQMEFLVNKYSQIMKVTPSKVKITSAEKRWGSCNSNKTVCFSYRAVFLSQKCKEYLVIHELSHLTHMNHSKDFYSEIEKYMSDYKVAEKELDGYFIRTI